MLLKLDSNENLFGASPLALAAAKKALTHTSFYPNTKLDELADFLQVHPDQLTLGNGSENVLQLIVRALLRPEDEVIVSKYAFLGIPMILKNHGARLITIDTKNFGHDLPGMAAALTPETRMIFVVNPNNPTGTCVTPAELIAFLQCIPSHVFVVLDEAYWEYLADYPNAVHWLPDYPNLIVVRTFSKAYGLAGLRLGYAVSSPDIATQLKNACMPFNVNRVALAAAQSALRDQTHLAKVIKQTKEGKRVLGAGLRQLNVSFIPSFGNFLMFEAGPEVYARLSEQGMMVRHLVDYDLPTHLRVTIGSRMQIERFLRVLSMILA